MKLLTLLTAWRAYVPASDAFVTSIPLAADHVHKAAAYLAAETQLHEACVAMGMKPGACSEDFAHRALGMV